MRERHNWGWPIACYLFLGGLGGGMIIVSGLADLILMKGELFCLGGLVGGIAIAVGSSLLVFELGRPLQFWRVFSTQRAIMTIGAWMLSLAIFTSLAYFSFWPGFSPWRDFTTLRHLFAGANAVLGFVVCLYTGILLGSLRARTFWNTPILPILFLVSALSTGIAAQSLLSGMWPGGLTHDRVVGLQALDLVLVVFEVTILFIYVLMMRFSSTSLAARVAQRWLTGSRKWEFWGLVTVGLFAPVVLHVLHSDAVPGLAQALILLGGLVLRFLIVYADDHTELPGEGEYYARLPEPEAPFLTAWE